MKWMVSKTWSYTFTTCQMDWLARCRQFYLVRVIGCSHHRHGQGKTVLSCLCQWCEHNWRQDQTVLFCLDPFWSVLSRLDPVSNFHVFSNPECIWDWIVVNWKLDRDETRLSCLVRVGGVNTTADKTRQFCLVSTQFPISKFSVILNVFETKQLVANWKLDRDGVGMCMLYWCVR